MEKSRFYYRRAKWLAAFLGLFIVVCIFTLFMSPTAEDLIFSWFGGAWMLIWVGTILGYCFAGAWHQTGFNKCNITTTLLEESIVAVMKNKHISQFKYVFFSEALYLFEPSTGDIRGDNNIKRLGRKLSDLWEVGMVSIISSRDEMVVILSHQRFSEKVTMSKIIWLTQAGEEVVVGLVTWSE